LVNLFMLNPVVVSTTEKVSLNKMDSMRSCVFSSVLCSSQLVVVHHTSNKFLRFMLSATLSSITNANLLVTLIPDCIGTNVWVCGYRS
jgi:hypothetical protein